MTPTWLITGSSRDFGRALAQAVLDAGDQDEATAWQEVSASADFDAPYPVELPAPR